MSETAAAVADAPALTEIPAGGAQATATTVAKVAEVPAAKSDDKATVSTEPTASGVPEKYALAVADPALVTAEHLTAFEAEAKAIGLTQAQAQATLDRRIEAMVAQSEQFRGETEADPVYGGAKLTETQQMAESVLARFAPKGTPLGDRFRAVMSQSGYGNELSVVAILAQIGKAMAEDTPAGGGKESVTEKPVRAADRAYAKTTSAHVFQNQS